MTMRSLRYTHEKSCVGKKIVRDEVPVKRQTRPKASTKPNQMVYNVESPNVSTSTKLKVVNPQEDLLKNHFQKLKEEKVRKHQEKISKLISKIA